MAVTKTTIHIPEFGWKALNETMHALEIAINSNRPIEGAGIRLTSHGEDGVEIARADVAANSAAPQTQGGGGGGSGGPTDGQWITVNVVDDNCNKTTMQVWGKIG